MGVEAWMDREGVVNCSVQHVTPSGKGIVWSAAVMRGGEMQALFV